MPVSTRCAPAARRSAARPPRTSPWLRCPPGHRPRRTERATSSTRSAPTGRGHPGTEGRGRGSRPASARVGAVIRRLDTRVLVGSVVENTNGSLTLEVSTGGAPNVAQDVVRLRARVPVAPGDLVALERRTLD